MSRSVTSNMHPVRFFHGSDDLITRHAPGALCTVASKEDSVQSAQSRHDGRLRGALPLGILAAGVPHVTLE